MPGGHNDTIAFSNFILALFSKLRWHISHRRMVDTLYKWGVRTTIALLHLSDWTGSQKSFDTCNNDPFEHEEHLENIDDWLYWVVVWSIKCLSAFPRFRLLCHAFQLWAYRMADNFKEDFSMVSANRQKQRPLMYWLGSTRVDIPRCNKGECCQHGDCFGIPASEQRHLDSVPRVYFAVHEMACLVIAQLTTSPTLDE
jgi:hypothetical protein